jgi:hypothetical protein
MSKILIALILLTPFQLVSAANQWMLQQSTLTYHVSHPMHHVEGVSHAARGKGVCNAGDCNFLIAVPVKSFNSGDSNRDLHMLQVVRGAAYPMVIVRARFPEPSSDSATIRADVTVQFAGQTAEYKQVSFRAVTQGDETHISGTIPATLSGFKISPPEFLMIPIKNDIPVSITMTWKRGG